MSSSSDNGATPVLLTKETIPRDSNVYHRLEPHLLNGKLIYKLENTNSFVPSSLLAPTTGKDIVKAISDNPVVTEACEDKIFKLMKSETGTTIMTDVYNQAKC